MVSARTSKFIKSLQLKKYRLEEKKFIIEGTKSVLELIKSDFNISMILATDKFITQLPDACRIPKDILHVVTKNELTKISNLKVNDTVLAVAEFRADQDFENVAQRGKSIALDGVQDPGNMGTIIRVADWYGIQHVICSQDCVDFYNPKVIQATMGSFTRVRVKEVQSLSSWLSTCAIPVMGAFMEGESIHQFDFPSAGILVIGNESNGISTEVAPCITTRVTIPKYGDAESLNAGIATAIMLDRWVGK